MIANKEPKFHGGCMTAEKEKLITLSLMECEGLTLRAVRCPNCESIIDEVYSDATGHHRYKCQKCKAETTINLKYFRRRKQYFNRARNLKRRYGI